MQPAYYDVICIFSNVNPKNIFTPMHTAYNRISRDKKEAVDLIILVCLEIEATEKKEQKEGYVSDDGSY